MTDSPGFGRGVDGICGKICGRSAKRESGREMADFLGYDPHQE